MLGNNNYTRIAKKIIGSNNYYTRGSQRRFAGHVIVQIRRSRGKFMLGNIYTRIAKKIIGNNNNNNNIYADRKENTGQCNRAKNNLMRTKNYCRSRFTSNGRECVCVSIVP